MIPIDTGDDAEMMVDINTTPLVDVLLVLLVMLIITIPIQLHAIDMEMPSTNAPPPPTEPRIVRLDVTATGGYTWDDQPVASREDLELRLRDAAAQPDPPEIHLRPDRKAKYEQVAAALASAQRLGLQKIGIVGAEQFAR